MTKEKKPVPEGDEFVRRFPAHEIPPSTRTLAEEIEAHGEATEAWREKLKAELKAEILAELTEEEPEESSKKKK